MTTTMAVADKSGRRQRREVTVDRDTCNRPGTLTSARQAGGGERSRQVRHGGQRLALSDGASAA